MVLLNSVILGIFQNFQNVCFQYQYKPQTFILHVKYNHSNDKQLLSSYRLRLLNIKILISLQLGRVLFWHSYLFQIINYINITAISCMIDSRTDFTINFHQRTLSQSYSAWKCLLCRADVLSVLFVAGETVFSDYNLGQLFPVILVSVL